MSWRLHEIWLPHYFSITYLQTKSLYVHKYVAWWGISSRERYNWICFLAYSKFIINFLRKKNSFSHLHLMQLLSADSTILKNKFKFFFAHENMKKPPSKVVHNWHKFFFQYCQPAQNQPESQFLVHDNCSPYDLCIMTLLTKRSRHSSDALSNLSKPFSFEKNIQHTYLTHDTPMYGSEINNRIVYIFVNNFWKESLFHYIWLMLKEFFF